MKLYLITFTVKLKQDKEVLTVQDVIVVPAKSDKSAQKFFKETVESAPAMMLRYNLDWRIMVPIKDMNAEVSIISCVKQ